MAGRDGVDGVVLGDEGTAGPLTQNYSLPTAAQRQRSFSMRQLMLSLMAGLPLVLVSGGAAQACGGSCGSYYYTSQGSNSYCQSSCSYKPCYVRVTVLVQCQTGSTGNTANNSTTSSANGSNANKAGNGSNGSNVSKSGNGSNGSNGSNASNAGRNSNGSNGSNNSANGSNASSNNTKKGANNLSTGAANNTKRANVRVIQ
jgi:hypothetical protein